MIVRYNQMVSRIASSVLLDVEIIQEQRDLLSYYGQMDYKTASDRSDIREAYEAIASPKFLTFIKDVAVGTGYRIQDLMRLFKDSRVVKFFKAIAWSFKNLYDLLKRGFRAYRDIQKAVGEYLASTRVGKWTTEELGKLDQFLKTHPRVKNVAGIAVAGLLVYFWFNQSFIGDVAFDFDMSYILNALGGSFSLADLFGGPSGIQLLLAVAVGFATGATFPWPGPASVKFISAMIATIALKIKKRVKKTRDSVEDQMGVAL